MNWVGWGALAGGVVAAIVGGLAVLMLVLRKIGRPYRGRLRRAAVPRVRDHTWSAGVGHAAAAAAGVEPESTFRPVPTGFAPPTVPVTVPVPDGSAGSVATATIPTAVYCTTCGHRVDAGSSYCGACGARNPVRD